MSPRARMIAVQCAAGLALGSALSFIGFGDYRELHRMFTFADLRLLFTFAGAVAITGLGLRLFVRTPLPSRPMTRGAVLGGALFGAGWVLTGACPGIALVQLGEGTVSALVTLTGIFVGIRAYDTANARWLHWDTGSCGG